MLKKSSLCILLDAMIEIKKYKQKYPHIFNSLSEQEGESLLETLEIFSILAIEEFLANNKQNKIQKNRK